MKRSQMKVMNYNNGMYFSASKGKKLRNILSNKRLLQKEDVDLKLYYFPIEISRQKRKKLFPCEKKEIEKNQASSFLCLFCF